jgi:hypothetical protein
MLGIFALAPAKRGFADGASTVTYPPNSGPPLVGLSASYNSS